MSLCLVGQSHFGQVLKRCGCFLLVCLSSKCELWPELENAIPLVLNRFIIEHILFFWQHPKSYKLWSVGDCRALLTVSRADIAADKPPAFNHSLVKAFPYIAPATAMNCWALLVCLTWSLGSVDLASRWHSLAAACTSPVASLPQSSAAELQLSIFPPQSTGQLALEAIIWVFLLSENCSVWICGCLWLS